MNIVRLSVVLGGVVNERMYYSKSISMESDCATPIWGVNTCWQKMTSEIGVG